MLFFVPQNPLTPGDYVAIFVSLIGPFGPTISPFFLRKMEISKKLLSQIEKKLMTPLTFATPIIFKKIIFFFGI